MGIEMFEEFLATVPDDVRDALREVIDHVSTVAPRSHRGSQLWHARFRYRDSPLLGFRVAAQHVSLFPFSPEVVAAVAPQLDGHRLSKGTIRFSADHRVPTDVLTEVVRLRADEIDNRRA